MWKANQSRSPLPPRRTRQEPEPASKYTHADDVASRSASAPAGVSRALCAAVVRFLRREAAPTAEVLVGLHRVFIDPRRVARLLAAHRSGAKLGRALFAEGRAGADERGRGAGADERVLRRLVDDARFDWGMLELVPAVAPLVTGPLVSRPRDRARVEDALPTPLREQIGTLSYYEQRHEDCVRRRRTPPRYYLAYGAKYVARFSLVVKPQLSARGQAWVDRALGFLQAAIEDELAVDRERFAALEADDTAFRSFAYATHPSAYLRAGLHALPPTDLAIIARAPDAADLQSVDGIAQVIATANELIPSWQHDLVQHALNGGR